MINSERLLNSFLEMVQIPSPSRKEGKMAAYIQEELVKLGFQVIIDHQAGHAAGSETGNLIGYLRAHESKAESLLFSAHLDTVNPCECIRPQVKGEIVCSDGSSILGADDKAGIAAILEAVKHLKEEGLPHGPLEVAFTICEEISLLGSRYLDYSLLRSKRGYILDGGGEPGIIINRGPAHDKFRAVIRGKAAHAGINPEEGISAIQVAAAAISRMKLLRIDEETTANIGLINGGGATNIVTDYVELLGEARSLKDEKLDAQGAHIKECLEQACQEYGAVFSLEISRAYQAFLVAESDPVVCLAVQAAEELGLPGQIVPTGGGSDVNYFNTKGLKTINLGTGMSKVHTTEEYIKIEDLEKMARLVAGIITKASSEAFNN